MQTYTSTKQSFINTLTPLGFLRKQIPFFSKAKDKEYLDSREAFQTCCLQQQTWLMFVAHEVNFASQDQLTFKK